MAFRISEKLLRDSIRGAECPSRDYSPSPVRMLQTKKRIRKYAASLDCTMMDEQND
jgi:hypothetical protein